MAKRSPKRAISPATFGRRVLEVRTDRRLSQSALAARAGLSYKFVGEVERGTTNPTLTTMASLATALRCDLASLLASDYRPVRTLKPADAARMEKAIRVLQSFFPARRRRS